MGLTTGTRLGRYEIREKLGAGGMAEVYRAEDTELKRLVAIKLLPADTVADEQARKRLLREARSVAALTHPHICAVYDIGEDQGHRFIAMQLVDGEPLDVRLARGRLSQKDALTIACDIADALAEAHQHGVIHRDIKPSNVIVTPRGGAVVLDFGLARLVADDDSAQADVLTQSALSAPGVVLGTVPYMSPEQVKGEVLDGRSDIFSFGALLYEMLGGRRPFSDKTSAATAAAILTRDPQPISELAPDVSPEVARIVTKTLRRNPDDRYQTAKDLYVDLRAIREGLTSGATVIQPGPAQIRSGKPYRSIGIAVLVAAMATGGWYVWRQSRVRAAQQQIARLDPLVAEGRFFEAYDLATAAERVLPGDPTLARLMRDLAMTISVSTEPAGASVYLRRYQPDAPDNAPARVLAGTTPLTDLRVARGDYVLQIEKVGFAPAERTISGTLIRPGTLRLAPPPIAMTQRLIPARDMPGRMVAVPAVEYRLAAWERPTDRRVALDDYFIDKYEVSNRDFKEFIAAGGYVKPEYWKFAFVKDGRTLSREEAMRLFVDRSGLPGPREWNGQNVPEGKADHPVTGVTWYEAAAYAAFRGKTLPTLFQWERAARFGVVGGPVNYMPWGPFDAGDSTAGRANFDSAGTVPVTNNAFGMSPFGAYNMAGNVKEWTLNDSSEGFLAAGGAWGDPAYVFAQFPKYPGFYSSPKLGFRCALNVPGAKGNQGADRIELKAEIPSYTASSAADFEKWRALYDYAPTPLDARVENVVETDDWRRERITFAGANGQRAIAYLYLPRHVTRPLQVIHFVPAADVERGLRALPVSTEDRVGAFIKAGRAAFTVVLTGYVERLRPAGVAFPDARTAEYFDEMVGRITDLRRGLDYLATRQDIDSSRIGFFGPSAGGQIGLVLAAVEPRYKAVAFMGSGLPVAARQVFAAANPVNFAAHIKPPKLMMHGKYDEDTPLLTAGMPLYELLRQPKRIVLFDGGHSPTSEMMFQTIGPFFDEVMGKVRR